MPRPVPSKVKALFGKGSYTVPEAARLLHMPAPTIRRWTDGYHFTRAGGVRTSTPVIQRELKNDVGVIELSFLDLIELLFVNRFHRHGVSLAVIRKTAARAADMYGADKPFCDNRFRTDGRTIFAEMAKFAAEERREVGGPTTVDLRDGQQVISLAVSPYFKKLRYDETGFANEWYPMQDSKVVALNPRLGFGQPVVREFGVPTRALKQAAESKAPLASIAKWFAIPLKAVEDALAFEATLTVPAAA